MEKEKVKQGAKKTLWFLFNPRLILCFGIAWIITNGWSYILMVIGTWLQIEWMMAVAGAYLAFLWLPISPEKLLTVAIAIVLLKWLFPNDTKTLAVLVAWRRKAKNAVAARKAKKKNRNARKAAEEELAETEGSLPSNT